ncbi:MAG: glycosyl transferase family 36 [Phycisphaerae bacterium]|nr:glycosyl transferase family 36 [Phycisphaerae bacterium]
MSTAVKAITDSGDAARAAPLVSNPYGHFATDGSEFRITDAKTPRPWANIIATPRLGLAVSHTGSGFTWIDNSQLAVITRWQQDLAHDSSGKFLYVRDADTGALWSLSPAPVWAELDEYACRHGLGYTTFETAHAGIAAKWTLFCHPREPVELWRVELQNLTDRPRRLELCAYLEWCCGVAPSPRREFHKLFLETEFDAPRRAIFARNHMWEVPTEKYGHWNTSFPYESAFACTEKILSAQGDKAAFVGRYGSLAAPEALREDVWKLHFGRHEDAIAALRSAIELRPGQKRPLGYALAVAGSRDAVEHALDETLRVDLIDQALEETRSDWRIRLAGQRVDTPEPSINYLVNDWLRYQAISGRLWGRCGYYQQSGAFGFRDQLQDSQVWLPIDPARCRAQIKLHAAHQFADGSVYHWWHPLSEQGHVTRMTDDLLWLAFVTANYIRETGDLSVLQDTAPFIDDPQPQPLVEHVRRAFARVFKRTSPRGLPYIGAGDWNDGLSAAGLQERGESIWLGHFLAGLLADWAEIYGRTGDLKQAADFDQRRTALIAAINEYGWDGGWYLRATLDNGAKLGSAENRVARIFLNAQTWAVLNDVAPAERAAQCMAAVRKYLVGEAGALLLAPAFDRPVPEIGYITRYAPGLRENGGVYTHAATWAIAAACKMRDHELVGRLLTAINPAVKDPERYWAEPYVLPGNVDGPDSPHFCRGGWTWYTGSAAWLHRVIHEWVLGVRPEWDGLRLDPCLPPGWDKVRVRRSYRGSELDIMIVRDGQGTVTIKLDGQPCAGNVVPATALDGKSHQVHVSC